LPVNDLGVVRGGCSSRSVKVIAERAMKANDVQLVPLVSSLARVAARGGQPWECEAKVTVAGSTGRIFYLLGTASLPPTPSAALAPSLEGTAPSLGGTEAITAHEWKNSHFPWPFWLVKRCEQEENANCILAPWLIRSINAMSAAGQEPVVGSYEVTIPVMVNTKDISKGEELVVYWPSKAQPKASKVKSQTWVDSAAKQLKKKARN
jgi:hypothetical protein